MTGNLEYVNRKDGCWYLGATWSPVCPPKASKNEEVDSCDRREDLQMKEAAHWYRMVNLCRGHRESRSKHLLHFHVQPVEKHAVAHSPFSALLAVSESSLASLIRGSGAPCPQQSLNSVARQRLTLLNPCVPLQCSPGLETVLRTKTSNTHGPAL